MSEDEAQSQDKVRELGAFDPYVPSTFSTSDTGPDPEARDKQDTVPAS